MAAYSAPMIKTRIYWRARDNRVPCGGLGGCGGGSRRAAQPPKGGLKKKCVQMG